MELCHVDVEDDVDLDSYDVQIPWLLNTTKLQKIKTFQCNLCHKHYSKNSNLHKHKRQVHSKPHKCDICHKSFKIIDALLTHKRVHNTGEKQYVCDICCKGF